MPASIADTRWFERVGSSRLPRRGVDRPQPPFAGGSSRHLGCVRVVDGAQSSYIDIAASKGRERRPPIPEHRSGPGKLLSPVRFLLRYRSLRGISAHEQKAVGEYGYTAPSTGNTPVRK